MEFIDGVKINDTEELNKKYGNAKESSDMLIDIFA